MTRPKSQIKQVGIRRSSRIKQQLTGKLDIIYTSGSSTRNVRESSQELFKPNLTNIIKMKANSVRLNLKNVINNTKHKKSVINVGKIQGVWQNVGQGTGKTCLKETKSSSKINTSNETAKNINSSEKCSQITLGSDQQQCKQVEHFRKLATAEVNEIPINFSTINELHISHLKNKKSVSKKLSEFFEIKNQNLAHTSSTGISITSLSACKDKSKFPVTNKCVGRKSQKSKCSSFEPLKGLHISSVVPLNNSEKVSISHSPLHDIQKNSKHELGVLYPKSMRSSSKNKKTSFKVREAKVNDASGKLHKLKKCDEMTPELIQTANMSMTLGQTETELTKSSKEIKILRLRRTKYAVPKTALTPSKTINEFFTETGTKSIGSNSIKNLEKSVSLKSDTTHKTAEKLLIKDNRNKQKTNCNKALSKLQYSVNCPDNMKKQFSDVFLPSLKKAEESTIYNEFPIIQRTLKKKLPCITDDLTPFVTDVKTGNLNMDKTTNDFYGGNRNNSSAADKINKPLRLELLDLCSLLNKCKITSPVTKQELNSRSHLLSQTLNTASIFESKTENSKEWFTASSETVSDAICFTSLFSMTFSSNWSQSSRNYSDDLNLQSIIRGINKIAIKLPYYTPLDKNWYDGFDKWNN